MKRMRLIMGMPIIIDVVDKNVEEKDLEEIFSYFQCIDHTFSTYKKTSEISRLNDELLRKDDVSQNVSTILKLAEETKVETHGFFDIEKNGIIDPSGIVKGWAIYKASKLLKTQGFRNFYIDAGGDIQVSGKNHQRKLWSLGIRNPFNQKEIVKKIFLYNKGIATSGTYMRGHHVYNPHKPELEIADIVSITVIGPTVFDADRFATAAFAMGKKGIDFIEKLPAFEGYMIDTNAIATMTTGFQKYVKCN